MKDLSVPIVKELVFVGGGHTHALVLRKWGMKPVPGVRVTMINPGPTAPYSGMLPGHIAGHYKRAALEIDLVRLARYAGARVIVDRAVALDPMAKHVRLSSGRVVPYDVVSLDVGITSEMPALKGFAEHGIAAKPLGIFADRWAQICAEGGDLRIAVLGGGVAGCEVAMAAVHRLATLGRRAEVSVIDRGTVLSAVVPAARRRLLAGLERLGVRLVEGAAPVEVKAGAVLLEDGHSVQADLVIGTAGATPHPWVAESGLPCSDGFLEVDEYLRSTADQSVYAAGDCAHVVHDPRPKAGVFAVRAAPFLAHNLRADLVGAQRKAFRPQRDFLKLITLGGQRAVAEKSGFAAEGDALWRWKDSIDQKFMDQFRSLPRMADAVAPVDAAKGVAAAMAGPAPCGGCGAKLGAAALAPVGGAGEDAAILGDQVLSTDHLRAFAEDPALVTRVAAVHALGDVWAMGARPEAALAQVILPRLGPELQGPWLEEVMAAAREVFAEAGAQIVGGHSSMGSELTVGFTVTGRLERPPVTLAGAKPGDALVLTKPLGSGVILAAEMRGQAPGEVVLGCWTAMQQGQGTASAALAPLAHAMTDVTGFGLAGHLRNICAESGVGAEIDLAALPVLPGAEDLAEAGVRSTLFAANRAVEVDAPEGPRTDLLFDPQTAGGLLASVAPDAVPDGMARIGTVTKAMGLRAR